MKRQYETLFDFFQEHPEFKSHDFLMEDENIGHPQRVTSVWIRQQHKYCIVLNSLLIDKISEKLRELNDQNNNANT